MGDTDQKQKPTADQPPRSEGPAPATPSTDGGQKGDEGDGKKAAPTEKADAASAGGTPPQTGTPEASPKPVPPPNPPNALKIVFRCDAAKNPEAKEAPFLPSPKSLPRGSVEGTTAVDRLREDLKKIGLILDTDLFVLDGAEVEKSKEKDLKVSDLLASSSSEKPEATWTIHVKRSVTAKIPDAVALPTAVSAAHTFRKELSDNDQVSASKLSARGSSSTAEVDPITWDLAVERALYERLNVFRGILYANGVVTWSYLEGIQRGVSVRNVETLKEADKAVYGKETGKFLRLKVPNETYIQNEEYTYSKIESDVRKMVAGTVSASVRYKAVSVNAEASASNAKRDVAAKSKLYCFNEVIAPKLMIWVDQLEPTAELAADLATFAKAKGHDYASFEALYNLFRRWGAYFAREIIVGGKLYVEEEKVIENQAEESAAKESFRAAAKVEFLIASADASAAGERASEEAKAQAKQRRCSMIQAYGGDAALVSDLNAWTASLGTISNWRVCKVAELTPIYMLTKKSTNSAANSNIRRGIYNTLTAWDQQWRDLGTMLDFESYIEPLRAEFGRFKLD